MAMEVERSVVIDAPAAKVWETIGAFAAIQDWHPAIASCALQEIDGTTHRLLTTVDGAEIHEKLLGHDDDGMVYSYTITESPLPVAGYISEIRVEGEGAGARVTWSSRFTASGAGDDDARAAIAGIYEAGLDTVRAMLAP